MGILSGNPKDEPLHYGEITNIWTFSTMAKGTISAYNALSYHAGDKDLIELLKDIVEQAKTEAKECDKLLQDNNITPPPSLPERPNAELNEIPVGARFTDQEIAVMVSRDIALGLTSYSHAIGTSIREDVAALFAKYHGLKMTFGLRALRMSKEKGWLIPPPLQVDRPEFATV